MRERIQKIKRVFTRTFLLFLLLSLTPFPARAEGDLPTKAIISGVQGHPQTYPLSCESRSAVDWAAYFGVEISERKFLNHLPRSDNPNQGFVGRPVDPLGNIPPRSYGVHAEPVAALLREYGLPAQARFELKWQQIQAELAADRPVIVWVIGQMWNGSPISYTASDGEQTTVARYEHTMILVGYTPRVVIAIEAATGQEGSYPMSSFLASWEILGRMAIIANNPEEAEVVEEESETPIQTAQATVEEPYPTMIAPIEEPIPTVIAPVDEPVRDAPRIYTVRRGDYLTGIARRFGVNWRNLARVNHLTAPYILYTGQKLRLP